ncbi:MAG: hypothetical protein ABNH26_09780 [Celeribacter sp.]|jgi:hypothetical protein
MSTTDKSVSVSRPAACDPRRLMGFRLNADSHAAVLSAKRGDKRKPADLSVMGLKQGSKIT